MTGVGHRASPVRVSVIKSALYPETPCGRSVLGALVLLSLGALSAGGCSKDNTVNLGAPVCKPGTHCNSKNQVEVCSEDGDTLLETHSCGTTEGCEEGECKPRACPANAIYCKSGVRTVCSASGTSEQAMPCGERQTCVDEGRCEAWVCEPGADYCEGAEPRRCAPDGLSFTSLGAACSGDSTCSAGVCEPWVCEPAAEYCEGTEPRRCAANGLSFTSLGAACSGASTCSAGVCEPWVCDQPSADYCAGMEARSCAADGLSSSSLEVCLGVQACITGACADYEGYARGLLPGTPGHPHSYTVDAAAKTVLDNVTGLLWQREPAPNLLGRSEAVSYCDTLTWGGRSDWRLPTRMELFSLVDYGQSDPAIDSAAFPSSPSDEFWAASARPDDNTWFVSFRDGTAFVFGAGASYVRCVAEGTPQRAIPASGHFFETTDDTVMDHATGLEWQRGSSPSAQSQVDSISYCDSLSLSGKTDWRLPTVVELSSLMPARKDEQPLIDLTVFPDTQTSAYWSASPVAASSLGWYVSFDAGYTNTVPVGDSGWARCVR